MRSCTAASWATAAGAARKSRRTRRKSLLGCATEEPSARPSLCASKTAIGPTGRKSSPSKPPRTTPARKNSSHLAPATPIWQARKKFNYHDARYILERASARETAARVAAGAFAKLFLRELGTEIASHTVQVGHVKLDRAAAWEEIRAISGNLESPLRCVDSATEAKMKSEVDAALKAGDTVGGIFEVVAHQVPVGLAATPSGTKNSMENSHKLS